MPGDIDELRRRVLIARVTKKRQAEAVPEEEEPGLFSQAMTGVKDNFVDKAKAVGGLFTGTSPAENIPLVGPLMRKGANYASAALIAPFTDKSVGDIYDESEAHDAGTAKKEMRENPGAQELKSTLGSFALPLPGSMTNKFIPEATGAVAKFGRGLLGAGEAAGVNAGISYGDARARDLSHEEAKDAAQNAALISGGINSAIPAAKLMGKAYSRVVANIKPDTLEHYRGNRDAINTMKPTDAYEEFSGAANTIRNKADALENQTKNSIESDRQRGMAEGTYRQQAANAKAEAEREIGRAHV